jgi:acetylornithine deacetylase
MLDLKLFQEMLSIDSTSGHEDEMMAWLRSSGSSVIPSEAKESPFLLLTWGTPRVVFCTHVDTVPPYIPPTFQREDGTPCDPQEAAVIRGRGACDAKGQLFAMLTACRRLADEGCTDFGLLLVTGEETGSWGAKAFAKTDFRAPYLIIGEPTENKMVSASKGTKAYQLTFKGEAFHSGYPQFGHSAVDAFVEFYNALKAVDFGLDPILGETTWNIGRLSSDNPQNILSAQLTCRLYFRTTFVSDEKVQRWMEEIPGQARNDGKGALDDRMVVREGVVVEAIGGDTPAEYMTLPGFETAPAAFGSDAPHLTNFAHKIICGPGSIRVAHRDDEHILVRDLEQAVEQYIKMFKLL